MLAPTPAVLLENPELVSAQAPWCTWLENHELAILLLAQPWLARSGVRRSELQGELERLAGDLPLGPLYFQRISRSAELLADRGQLRRQGSGRARRYQTTVGGLAALILNLQVLRADPTVDGSEFEMKRALVALWNLVAVQMTGAALAVEAAPGMARLLEGLGHLEIWGRPVISDAVLEGAFDLLGLIRTQRERVAKLEVEAEARRRAVAAGYPLAASAGPSSRKVQAAVAAPESVEEAVALARAVATGIVPRIEAEAAQLRYRAYARYLEGLGRLYTRTLPVVDLASVRRAVFGGGA